MIAAIIDAAALTAAAVVFGGMVFFAFVYAPLVFIKLGKETGGRFIREVFPVYYVAMGATSIATAVLLAFASAARGVDALAMACIGIVFFLARFAMLPIIKWNIERIIECVNAFYAFIAYPGRLVKRSFGDSMYEYCW